MSQSRESFVKAELPIWPEGLFMHPQTQAESFQLQAMLTPVVTADQPEPGKTVAFIAQMDRLAIRPEIEQKVERSGWQYGGIVRSSVFVDSANTSGGDANNKNADSDNADPLERLATLVRDQWIQRMALELGGVTRQTLWVGNDQIAITLTDTLGTKASPSCYREYRWTSVLSLSDSMELQFSIDKCPQALALGPLISWQQASQAMSASLKSSDMQGNKRTIPMRGFGWIRHSWGNLPALGGAVLIDTLQIRLDDQRWLDISRSKRRSGRGPRTVLATLHTAGLPETQITLEWEDSDEQVVAETGTTYPRNVHLRNSDSSIALQVTIMNRLSESSELSGKRLHVPVAVSGSHTGGGFLLFNALPVVP